MSTETQAPIVVAPARYVMLPLANVITGYTVKAGTFSFLEEFPDYRYRDELSEVKGEQIIAESHAEFGVAHGARSRY